MSQPISTDIDRFLTAMLECYFVNLSCVVPHVNDSKSGNYSLKLVDTRQSEKKNKQTNMAHPSAPTSFFQPSWFSEVSSDGLGF